MNPSLTKTQRRVVILGASNVARGISTIVQCVRNTWREPLDLIVANGHGRSFGMTSRVLGRSLPAITDCELWNSLKARPQLPTTALVTDIGNDLLYGASVDQIVAWVQRCIDNLADCDRLLLTALPMESLVKVGPSRYYLMRSILFPKSRLTFAQARQSIQQLNKLIVDQGERDNVVVVQPQPNWYGLDPIHIRMRDWNRAWRDIFFHFLEEKISKSPTPSPRLWWRLRFAIPHERKLFGWSQCAAQPSLQWEDGTCLSLY